MRLDKFLKMSRIIKRRPVAKAVCDGGRVLVNDHQAKAGKELHEGDILRIDLNSRILTCQILSIPTGNVRAAEASSLYEIISEEDMETILKRKKNKLRQYQHLMSYKQFKKFCGEKEKSK